jgi:hypothetical protein
MRTFEDYLNTPELAGEPEFLQEIHAARLKIQDDIKGMTVAERAAYFNRAAEFLACKPEPRITETANL